MRLHEYLRGDLTALEAMLEQLEFEGRKMQALISSIRLIADDVETLEEGAVETLDDACRTGQIPVGPPASSALALALARAVIVDGVEGMTLGAFLERVLAYGDARVAEALEREARDA